MNALDPVREETKHELDAACSNAARTARLQITEELNQCLRRFRHYRNEGEWIAAVLDTACGFVSHVAVFALKDGLLSLRGQRNLALVEQLSFPAASAGAFANAVATKDPVIALRTVSEVGEALSARDKTERACVVPIANGTRVVAFLFAADRDPMDVNALELIAGIASAVLERRSNNSLHTQIVVTGAD